MPISHPTIVFAIAAALYTLPSFVAVVLGRRHQWGVFAINLATGWTVIGWMASLRWALAKSRPRRLRRARTRGGRPTSAAKHIDSSAMTERARLEESWADAASLPNLYAQWLDAGAVRREREDTPSLPAAAPALVPILDTPRKAAKRKSSSFSPTSAAA